jgi:hypothetical protein
MDLVAAEVHKVAQLAQQVLVAAEMVAEMDNKDQQERLTKLAVAADPE